MPSKLLHLTASMRIIAKHANMRRVSIAAAQDTVKALAFTAARDRLLEEDKPLVVKLERACGCTIAELAVHAEDWAR